MDIQTRHKALRALKTAKCAVGENIHFPMVFVCGTHVFFTFMAAWRQQRAYKFFDGIEPPIEKVETTYTTLVKWDENQRGELMPGELFPGREYAQLINA